MTPLTGPVDSSSTGLSVGSSAIEPAVPVDSPAVHGPGATNGSSGIEPNEPAVPRELTQPSELTQPTELAVPRTPEASVEPRQPARHHPWVWVGVVVLWLAGLGAGLVAGVTVAARASCVGSTGGFGCGNGGSAVGIALVLIVIGVVGTATVYALDAKTSVRSWLRSVVLGLVVLGLVVVAARLVVSTL